MLFRSIGNSAAIGTGAVSNTGSLNNVIVGHNALSEIHTATGNIIIGNEATYSGFGGTLYDTIVIGNSAVRDAGSFCYSGIYIGNNTCKTATGHTNHIVIGHECFPSGAWLSYNNTLIGSRVAEYSSGQLANCTFMGTAGVCPGLFSASYSIAIGSYIADSYYSAWSKNWFKVIAIGNALCRDDKERSECIYMGDEVGSANADSRNIMIGNDICKPTGVTQSGTDNVFIGGNIVNYYGNSTVIMQNVAIGGENAINGEPTRIVAIGYQAGQAHTTGDQSVYVGYQAAYQATGSYNTAIGANTFGSLVTGQGNTAVGFYAGGTLTSGVGNTLIGAGANASAANVNDEFTLGDSSVATLRCNQTTITSISDERDKTNIEDLDHGVNFIKRLRPVKFDWARRDGSFEGKKDYGFIAQELQAVETELNTTEYTNLVLSSNPEKLEAAPLRTYPILVQAVKELINRLEAAEQTIAELQGT